MFMSPIALRSIYSPFSIYRIVCLLVRSFRALVRGTKLVARSPARFEICIRACLDVLLRYVFQTSSGDRSNNLRLYSNSERSLGITGWHPVLAKPPLSNSQTNIVVVIRYSQLSDTRVKSRLSLGIVQEPYKQTFTVTSPFPTFVIREIECLLSQEKQR